jgi:ribonuclease-3
MAKKAKTCEHISEITNYERLEFLGDALLEFLVSIHLFFLFPQFDEGRLSTFRVGLIQNHFFTSLARNLCLQHFIIYNHGPDLCSHSALNHALANSFEALMGAIYLDGGLVKEVCFFCSYMNWILFCLRQLWIKFYRKFFFIKINS